MREQWVYLLSCPILGDLLSVQGFLQSLHPRSLQQSRTRLVGTNCNPLLDVGRALRVPQQHLFCSVPTKASVDVVPAPAPSAASSESAAANQRVDGGDDDDLLFPFRHSSTVFIEMTDMYGIVYHANYLTYARRAIESTFGPSSPCVHCLHDMKYRAAATVGDELVIEGNLVVADNDLGRSRWRFVITAAADPSRVFVSAEVTLSWRGAAGAMSLPPGWSAPLSAGRRPGGKSVDLLSVANMGLLHPLPDEFARSPKNMEVVVWSDDLEGGGGRGGELSIRALLNYFERIRTLSLGRGPDGELGLRRLHREGVSVVVTSIVDLRCNSDGVVVGDKLEVRLGTKLTRGNRFMTMYETLWTKDGTLVAHAEVALLCMDNDTRKFISVPPWVQDVLNVSLTAAAE